VVEFFLKALCDRRPARNVIGEFDYRAHLSPSCASALRNGAVDFLEAAKPGLAPLHSPCELACNCLVELPRFDLQTISIAVSQGMCHALSISTTLIIATLTITSSRFPSLFTISARLASVR